VEPDVVSTLKRACKKLSASKQREIAAYNELIATPQKRPRKIPERTVEWRQLD
jgi:toxic protein SymE